MRKVSTAAIAALTTSLVTGAAVVLGAQPAFAETTGCSISGSARMCYTGTIPAHPTQHAVRVTAIPGYPGGTTCRVFDAGNFNEVGSVTSAPGFSRSKTIGGLNRFYYARCETLGVGGGGSLTNG